MINERERMMILPNYPYSPLSIYENGRKRICISTLINAEWRIITWE